MSEKLVMSAVASGRYVLVVAYDECADRVNGCTKHPVKSQILFRTPQDARECAQILSAAMKTDEAEEE